MLVADVNTDETETDETDTDDDAALAAPAPSLLLPETVAVVLVCEIDQAV